MFSGSRVVLVVVTVAMVVSGCLRTQADAVDHRIGYAIDPGFLTGNQDYVDAVVADANIVTVENHLKWGLVHPGPDTYDFSVADQIVDFAAANDMEVRGHVLVWHRQLPAWVTQGEWTREELIDVMRDHIHTVVGHYRDNHPGVVVHWDVVNEAFLPDGSRRPTIFQQVIGDDYLELAFRFAREADPDARLYYNDFYAHGIVVGDAIVNGLPVGPGANSVRTDCADVPKCVATRAMVEQFQVDGIPIDGVGFQGHIFGTDVTDYAEFASWTAPLGIDWALTEVDVSLVAGTDTAANRAAQAAAFLSMIEDCLDSPNCDTTIMWSVGDDDSWIPGETGGLLDHGSLRQPGYGPKLAYYEVWEALHEAARVD